MLEEKDYCDYDTCVALVDLGMRITSRKVYSDRNTLKHSSRGITYTVRTASAMGWVIAIPLYEAQKFLREEKNIIVEVFVDDDSDTPITYNIYKDGECVCHHHGKYWSVKDWNVALNEGIKETVKILKEE